MAAVPELLAALLRCHSTPGDEGEVAALLRDRWTSAGLVVTGHGSYALSARRPGGGGDRPVLLVCAHMDSPGFTVEQIGEAGLKLLRLGGAQFDGDETAGLLKTRSGLHGVNIRREVDDEGHETLWGSAPSDDVDYGDRICFRPCPQIDTGGRLTSPFLDNRLGCFVLCELADQLGGLAAELEVVVGATACEEFGGFGAPVLARATQPDIVICVDATYEDCEQDVRIGNGPVLTLSDASVILSPAIRDRVREFLQAEGVPLQTEVYNVSGTDSRAFPHQGLPCPVLPLLVATTGNHTPAESGSLADVAGLAQAIRVLAAHGGDLLGE